MRPLLRPEEMAQADAVTVAAGTPVEVLMERAGRALARTAIAVAGGRYGKRAVVVAGKGNNGGDGFVAARILRAEGLGVTCLVTFDPSESSGAAAEHLARMRAAGISPRNFDVRHLTDADVIVDAIFGTGFSGEPRGLAAEAIEAIDGHPNVVAADISSGVDGATGAVSGAAVHATVTVAFAAEKVGTALPPGAAYAGRVEIADIGIDPYLRALEDARHPDGTPAQSFAVGSLVEMVEAGDVVASLAPRSPDAHKRSVGALTVVAGSHDIRGAPILTAMGGVRAGAGYVTLGSTTSVKHAAIPTLPEIMCREVTDGEVIGPKALDTLADVLERSDALALGPGLGTGSEQTALITRALEEVELPIVLDADGLNALSLDPSPLAARKAATVITPHVGELARLLDVPNGDITRDRLAAALEASARFPGCVVLLKGWRTLISYGAGTVALVIPVGGPELATAGTGDVLTGAIGARLAGGSPPVAAAITGAWLHGVAGTIAAEQLGSVGVAATDVAESLPEAIEACRLMDNLNP